MPFMTFFIFYDTYYCNLPSATLDKKIMTQKIKTCIIEFANK